MNVLVYNYRCFVEKAVDGDTFDGVINLGWRLSRRARLKILGVELPDFHNGRDPEIPKIREAARTALVSLIEGRKTLIAPSRPNMYGRAVCRVYLACRRENPLYPQVTAQFAGVRFVNITNVMNLIAEKKFEEQMAKDIVGSLETYDY